MADGESDGTTRIQESTSSVLAAWAQVISALVGVFAAAAAAVVGYVSLEQGKWQSEQARTTRTLEFFATFTSKDSMETREALSNENWCARYRYSNEAYESSLSQAQVVWLIDFFDAVDRSCPPTSDERQSSWLSAFSRPSSDSCDRHFAEALFKPYAEQFSNELSPFILEGREGGRGEDFGQGIVSFARIRTQDAGQTSPPALSIDALATRYKTYCETGVRNW